MAMKPAPPRPVREEVRLDRPCQECRWKRRTLFSWIFPESLQCAHPEVVGLEASPITGMVRMRPPVFAYAARGSPLWEELGAGRCGPAGRLWESADADQA